MGEWRDGGVAGTAASQGQRPRPPTALRPGRARACVTKRLLRQKTNSKIRSLLKRADSKDAVRLIEWPEVAAGRWSNGAPQEPDEAVNVRGCVADLSAGWKAEIWVPR